MYDFSTFDNFIASTVGQTIGGGDAVDYVNLIWDFLGSQYYTYPPSDPSATDHSIKWGVLNAEALQANKIPGISFISNINQVKRGDIVILTGQVTGHGGFINEDYQGTGIYNMYSQNVNGLNYVVLEGFDLQDFGGAFRFQNWNPNPPIPVHNRNRFPWVLYAERLRKKQIVV